MICMVHDLFSIWPRINTYLQSGESGTTNRPDLGSTVLGIYHIATHPQRDESMRGHRQSVSVDIR
jgi:hypothetical protein